VVLGGIGAGIEMENVAASSTDYTPAQRRCPKRWVLCMLIAVEE